MTTRNVMYGNVRWLDHLHNFLFWIKLTGQMRVCTASFLGKHSSSNHVDDSTYSLMLTFSQLCEQRCLTVQDGHAYGHAFTNDIIDVFSGTIKSWSFGLKSDEPLCYSKHWYTHGACLIFPYYPCHCSEHLNKLFLNLMVQMMTPLDCATL
jgi:hypothetical protein